MINEKKLVRVLVKIYENGEESNFDDYSGKEYSSLMDTLNKRYKDIDYDFHNLEDTNYIFEIDEDFIKTIIGNRIRIRPKRYGVNPWGKVEVEFVIMKEDDLHE